MSTSVVTRLTQISRDGADILCYTCTSEQLASLNWLRYKVDKGAYDDDMIADPYDTTMIQIAEANGRI